MPKSIIRKPGIPKKIQEKHLPFGDARESIAKLKTYRSVRVGFSVVGYRMRALAANRLVKKATKDVGKALVSESQKNPEVRGFLGKYKYVIIDRKGNLVGTNRQRILGMGRLRLETKKILAGEY